ncbi:SDR family NAD(P)-dependent oxidoreductase [Actinomadura sp. HBU206391]|nr:SDR family NAD(P)-dependent oxidoreductase [Actinomadura sp. HBU206391]
MTGRTIVITGASSGIGAVAARRLTELGANVVPVGRSPERTARVAARLGAEPLIADYAHLGQVRDLADALLQRCPRIDVLVNNAGGLIPSRRVTADGHELTFQTNHLAPFLLTSLLLPRLRSSARNGPVRIVTTSSLGNRFGRLRMDDLEWEKRRYGGGWIAYATTKLMNVSFTRELARRTEGTGIGVLCFHPRPARRGGARTGRTGVPTRFAEGSPALRLLTRTPLRGLRLNDEAGAGPLVWLAASPEVGGAGGDYYDGLRKGAKVNPQADDQALALRLWDRSQELLRAFL